MSKPLGNLHCIINHQSRPKGNVQRNFSHRGFKRAVKFENQINQSKQQDFRDTHKIIGGQYGVEALIKDDSGQLLTQYLYPKEYIFTYLLNPSAVYLYDKTQLQLQSLAAIKYLLNTNVIEQKHIVQKIVQDLEKTLEFDHENSYRYWRNILPIELSLYTTWSKQMIGFVDQDEIDFILEQLQDVHSDLHQILLNPLNETGRALRLLKAYGRTHIKNKRITNVLQYVLEQDKFKTQVQMDELIEFIQNLK